jgi:Phage tail repeat like
MPFFNLGGGSTGGGGSSLPALSGSGTPSSSIGSEGQLYIDTQNKVLYGPKSSSGWGSGIPLVTTAWTDVTGKPSTFSPSSHSHVVSDVSGLQSSLDAKAATSHQHAIADVTNLQATLNGKAATAHQHAIGDVSGLQAALDAKQSGGNYATLVNGTVPASQLPSYVDDVIDVGSALPTVGETGKIYFISTGTNANKTYRWSGSSFIQIIASPSSTDAIAEGAINLYFTNARAIAAVQSQLDAKAAVSHVHTVSQITSLQTTLDGKAAVAHQHAIAEVTGLQSSLDGKAAASHVHTVSQVTGLQAALDGKATVSHVHAIADTTNLQATLDGKAPLTHSHTIAQVANLQASLDAKAAATHTHGIGDVTNLQSTLSGLQTSIDGKAAASHVHAVSQVTGLQAALDGKAASTHQHAIADVSGLQAALDAKQSGGTYATLVNGTVPASQLPSYVDDVVDVGGGLPFSGETGKIYVVSSGANSNKIYRWSGSSFFEIAASPGSTDAVPEGVNNLYFTTGRAVAAVQSQLDLKSPLGHVHIIENVTGLQSALDGKAAASHAHGNITSAGAIGTTGGLPIITTTSGVLTTGAFGATAGTVCQGNDSRLSDARTPTAHAASHGVGGSDALTLAISQVASLQTSLDGKAAASHAHAIADVTNLESRLQFASTLTTPPASDTASGTAGQLALDATYLYGCIAANTWRRIAWEAYGSAAAGITVTSQPNNQSASSSSGTVSMTSQFEPFSAFSYTGMTPTTYAQMAAFYDNGTVQYATSSAYENLLFTKTTASSSWTGMLIERDQLNIAASQTGQMDYSTTINTVLQPYRYVAGNANFIVLAREEHNYEYAYPYSIFMATSNTTSASPSFSRGTFASSDNTSGLVIGACCLAASPTMVVAGLINANKTTVYAYGVNWDRVYSQYALAYTTNGTNWFTVALPEAAAIYDIIYNSGRFVAVGSVSGGAPKAWTSTNGLSWTSVSLPTGAYPSLAAGNGKIVAVGWSENFVAYHGSTTGPWFRPENGLEIGSLTQRVIISSDNGATWTAVNSLPILETWVKVVYVPSISRFVAFATNNQICAVSSDGTNWDAVDRGAGFTVFDAVANIDDSLYGQVGSAACKMNFSVTGGGGGGTATFSVTATAATAISYQWQKSTDYGTSYQNISSATTSTLTLSGVTIADNGSRYRCKLTAGGVTIYSNSATLTVSA